MLNSEHLLVKSCSKLAVPLIWKCMTTFMCQEKLQSLRLQCGFSTMLWKCIVKAILCMEQNQTFGTQWLCFGPHMSGASSGSSVLHIEISGPKPDFFWQPGPAGLWFRLPGGQKSKLFLIHLNFHLQKEALLCT